MGSNRAVSLQGTGLFYLSLLFLLLIYRTSYKDGYFFLYGRDGDQHRDGGGDDVVDAVDG